MNFIDQGYEWVETTTMQELAEGHRTFIRGKKAFTNPEGASLEDIKEYVRKNDSTIRQSVPQQS